jgi:predicted RNase H-like HicB family nuclease
MGKPMAGFFSIEEAFRFNFMGNHATKIFHRNGDPTTNEWAIRPVALRGFFNRGETIEDVFVNLSSDLETILGQSRLDSNAENANSLYRRFNIVWGSAISFEQN